MTTWRQEYRGTQWEEIALELSTRGTRAQVRLGKKIGLRLQKVLHVRWRSMDFRIKAVVSSDERDWKRYIKQNLMMSPTKTFQRE